MNHSFSAKGQLYKSKFLAAYPRYDTGRFVVTMRLKEGPVILGDSKAMAVTTNRKAYYCNYHGIALKKVPNATILLRFHERIRDP